jgi:hypothetical protein
VETFLEQIAKKIYTNFNLNQLKDLTVVMPTRRSVFFFKQHLVNLSNTPFLAPNVLSIDDFIIKKSGLFPVDPILLYFKAFEIFKELDSAFTFERFSNYANILISDFENIDLALVAEPEKLFRYMSEAEAISRWKLDDDYDFSENAHNYFDFFSKVSVVYKKLKYDLYKNKQCYKGMAYRHVAENLEDSFGDEKVFFVGLNALSNAEEKIINYLVKNKSATCFWDTDDYYMNSDNKAGKKLRIYKNKKQFGDWNFQDNLLSTTKKQVNIYELQNDSLQADLVANIIKNGFEKNHVIVLLDENQFKPLLLSVPKVTQDFNITMGLPITHSNFYSFLTIYFEIKLNSSNSPEGLLKIHNKTFFKLIEHHFFSLMLSSQINDIQSIKSFVVKNNIVFVSQELLNKFGLKNNILNLFFNPIKNLAADVFFEEIQEIIHSLKNISEIKNNAIENAFLLSLENKIRLIKNIADSTTIDLKLIKLLLQNLLKSEKIPFMGEPVADLQIMSMLETRCLDFETVTFLSLNEGNLPSNQKNNSFIPFDAAKFFGLPLYSDQDAIMAYHFFRLLQRAENVNMIYLQSGGEGVGTKEKSRFITQIEEELAQVNAGIIIKYPKLNFNTNANLPKKELIIEKTPEVINEILSFLKNKGLYPTHLNDYFDCQLKFYWSRIKKVAQKDEISDKMGTDVFGNIIHYSLENLFDPYLKSQKPIEKEDLLLIKNKISETVDLVVKDNFSGFETSIGLNSVLKKIAVQLLIDFFNHQINNFTASFKVLSIEETFKHSFNFYQNDLPIEILIAGKADMIILKGNKISIIDFKTGNVKPSELKIENDNLVESFTKKGSKKLRQLLFYNYLFVQNFNNYDKISSKDLTQFVVSPEIISFRNLKADISLKMEKNHSDSLIDSLNHVFSEIGRDLLDLNKPIVKTSDVSSCIYCDFKELCGRNS